jgi:cellulose synthase (UDP-forming)
MRIDLPFRGFFRKPEPWNRDPEFLKPVLTGREKARYAVQLVIWLGTVGFFWSWWLNPAHNIGTFSFVILSILLAWISFMPAYLLGMAIGSKKPTGPVRLPEGSRVAMVVTKAPSEPFEIVAETLEAMLAQDYPHDTWLADEAPTPETIRWCAEHGVRISTRQGRADYHRETWPRRTRCKEGNLAFFYDHYGYDGYDFVAQLDADHVPQPGYLREVLRPFSDPRIGYVSAPSICDKNGGESWSARGRLYAEATLHGSLQTGHNNGWAPLCFGSHYAVRTKALREIGGLGPELAEDHSTTLMMNAHGWRGVHAVDAVAHGDGPKTFGDLVTQEFQWSRSLTTILLQYTPRYLPMMPGHLRFQFVFSQLWYPLFSFFFALAYVLPIFALIRGENFVGVTFPSFILHALPMTVALLFIVRGWKSAGMLRPVDSRIMSWEGAVFLLARWPWSLAGVIAAVRDWLTGSFVDFRVTPKGQSEVDPLPFRVLAPYAFLSIASALPALLVTEAGAARGFYLFSIINALLYALILTVIVVQHERENAVKRRSFGRRPAMAAALLAIFALPAAATNTNGAQGLEAVTFGAGRITLTERIYPVSGAGQFSAPQVRFKPRWISDLPEEEQ